MQGWSNITLGEIAKVLARYRPFLFLIAAILAIAVVLPGADTDTGINTEVAALNESHADDEAVGEGSADTSTTLDPSADGATAGSVRASGASGGGTVPAVTAKPGAKFGPDCDLATGRIKVPAFGAPPCMPAFSGDNGGATYQGVTKDSISVVWYRPKEDPAVTAALTAAGAREQPRRDRRHLQRLRRLLQHALRVVRAEGETHDRRGHRRVG